MTAVGKSKFTPALRNLLTGIAEYVASEEAHRFWQDAEALCGGWRQKFRRCAKLLATLFGNSPEKFIGCRFSPYFPHVPRDLDQLVDPNPGFGLASYHVDEVDEEYVRNLIENDVVPHSEDWEATFRYASKRYHSSLDWAKMWLLESLPAIALASTYPDNIDDEVCRKTHHALVVLQKGCPMPGFASAQLFHALFDVEFGGSRELRHHRALYADFDTQQEGLPPWEGAFLSSSGTQITLGKQEQTHPDCAEFKEIREFFETRLAYAFNTEFKWEPRGSYSQKPPPGGKPDENPDFSKPKGQEKKGIPNYRLLAFPVFETQDVLGNEWKRRGPYIGLFALLVHSESKQSQNKLLKRAARLGSLLNSLAAPIQRAREREFWSSRISEQLDDESVIDTLREYAATFCGVAIGSTTSFVRVTNVKAAIDNLHADKSGFVLPPVTWPNAGGDSRSTAWEAKWLPTTMLPSAADELTAFAHATMIRLREAEGRITAIRHFQEANRNRGLFASAHDYSKELDALDTVLEDFRGELADVRREVREMESESDGTIRERVLDRLDRLQVPEQWILLRKRFMMSHQGVVTSGAYKAPPEWCLRLISRGTRGAMLRLIRLLVWMPVSWEDKLALVQQHRRGQDTVDYGEKVLQSDAREELDAEHLGEWVRIFAYDEIRENPDPERPEELLSRYMRFLFLDEKVRVKKPEFARLHPPPLLSPGPDMSTQLLWEGAAGDAVRSGPMIGYLLPILVFSLRAAYQNAWLDQFLRAARHWEDKRSIADFVPVTSPVTLESKNNGASIHLTFADPAHRADRPAALGAPPRLIWGSWERDLERYKRLPQPWKWKLIHGENVGTLTIVIE